jgi:hypothetical protein
MGIVSVLLVRLAGALDNVNLVGYLWPTLLIMLGLTALIYSISWLFAKEELGGRQAWIMGFGMLIIASAVRAETGASLSWGVAAILTGGLIFLASVRSKITMWIALLGVIGISTLPFTAAWPGIALFSSPFSISMIFYFISIPVLIAGYVRHAMRLIPEPSGLERWIRVIYPIGLIVLPVIQLGIGWLYRPVFSEIALTSWIVNLLILVFAVLVFFWQQRGGTFPEAWVGRLNAFLGFKWLRSIVALVFKQLGRFVQFGSSILEGEGGVLWVLLAIVLFLAMLLITLGS